MLMYVLPVCFFLLGLSLIFTFARLIKGPSLPDRALALDTVAFVSMALLVQYGIWKGTKLYFEVALLVAVLAYISTVAVAKYMLRGDIIE